MGGQSRSSGFLITCTILAAGCSLSRLDPTGCKTNSDCWDAFGLGYTCDADAFCAQADALDRCDLFPADAAFPLDPAEKVLFASMFNRSNETHAVRIRSARLAVAQANDNGGLNGRDFVLLECTIEEDPSYDDLDQEGAVETIALALAEQIGVPAIVGPAASSDVETAFNAIGTLGTTMIISPSATSPALTDIDGINSTDEDPGLLWRTAPPDAHQGEVIASDMTARGVGSVSVVFQSGAYGDGLSQLFANQFGGTVTLLPFNSDSGRDQATVDAADGVDEVLFISSEVTDIVAFLNGAALVSGYDDLGIFLTDAAATSTVLTDASAAFDLFDQVRGTKPSIPSGNLYDTFVASYGSAYSGEDASAFSFTAHTYDASWLVIYAAAWAEAQGDPNSGLEFARGFRQLSDGTEAEIRATSWNRVKASFSEGLGVDVVGTSGQLDFDPETGETSAPIEVWTIDPTGSEIVVEYVSE